jgi:tRNA-binding protein
MTIDIHTFAQLDLRVGTVVHAEPFPEAREPAYRLTIDFGPLGMKRSSARIIEHYSIEELKGRQVVAVVNLPPKRIADFRSEVLVLGARAPEGGVVLLELMHPLPNGARVK